MKKIIITILCIVGVLTSCQKKLDEYGVSPNDPLTTSPALLLSGAEVGTFANYTGSLSRISALFTQQIAGIDGQFIDYAKYDLNDNTFTNEWTTIYQGTLVNTRVLSDKYGAGSPYYVGIGKILTAMNLALASDLWGDVPYTDALKGLENNFNAKYDKQEDIYNIILPKLLDEAIVELSKPANSNISIPAADDLIFGGNVNKWKSAAYILKARYSNRLSQVDPTGSATKVLNALAAADLKPDGSADMMAVFFDSSTSLNQWSAFVSGRPGYIKMGKNFIDILNSTNDPRLPFYATKDDNGGYTGTAVNGDDNTTSNPGEGIASNASPLPLVTYSEAKFIEAEAQLRLGKPSLAANAYNEAVKASVKKVTGSDPSNSFIIDNASEMAGSISLEKIIIQKYIALFTEIEPYNDFRRTGFPSLVPNSNGVKTQIPLRLPSSSDERLYNPNATIVTDVYAPVWWDK